jgi:hypothetical protein
MQSTIGTTMRTHETMPKTVSHVSDIRAPLNPMSDIAYELIDGRPTA